MGEYLMKVFSGIALFIIFFSGGWLLSKEYYGFGEDMPNTVIGQAFVNASPERASPSDIISEDKIRVYSDRIVIYVDHPLWAKFTDTNSMDPVFDSGSNALQIAPTSEKQIHVGDIISFTTNLDDGTIIHRVKEIGYDKDGWYALTKGDNNVYDDSVKIRFSQVKKLLFGIIY
jgi:hypothetical protein